MTLSSFRLSLAAAVLLSACSQPTAEQIAANGLTASDETVEDADARSDRLIEEASLLNAEAAKAKGARRQGFQNEARDDMAAAASVERQGETDADNITAATDNRIND